MKHRLVMWIDAALAELAQGYGGWWRSVEPGQRREELIFLYTGRLGGLRDALSVGRFGPAVLAKVAIEVHSILRWLACSDNENDRRIGHLLKRQVAA